MKSTSQMMALEVSHQNTPVAIRERLSLAHPNVADLLAKLKVYCDECFVLSTCNRLIIITITDKKPEIEGIIDPVRQYRLFFRWFLGAEAVARHMFCVACGLCSQLIGEEAIVNQIRTAYQMAHRAGTLGQHLHKLLDRSLVASKHLRANGLVHSTTYPEVLWPIITRSFHTLEGKKALIIGTGDVAQRLIPYTKSKGLDTVVLSKNKERCLTIHEKYGINAILIHDENYSLLADYDVVIGATQTLVPIQLSSGYYPKTKRQLWLDLGLPRNFDTALGEIERVVLYDIDQISARSQPLNASTYFELAQAIEYQVELYLHKYQRLYPVDKDSIKYHSVALSR